MNLTKSVVTEVIGEPEYKYEHWFIKVRYNSYGQESETELMFNTKERAAEVEPGFEFKN